MADPTPSDMVPLKQWLHDVNNRVGVILATAELLQLEQLPPQAVSRRQDYRGQRSGSSRDRSRDIRSLLFLIFDARQGSHCDRAEY